jgi:hypothetical protein
VSLFYPLSTVPVLVVLVLSEVVLHFLEFALQVLDVVLQVVVLPLEVLHLAIVKLEFGLKLHQSLVRLGGLEMGKCVLELILLMLLNVYITKANA